MLAWSEGTDNGRQKTRNQWLWRHCRRRAMIDYSDHLKTCHAKPKTQINRRRTLPASFPLVDVTGKQLGLKDFSPKSQTLWHCSRLRSVALTYDWSWWYPSGNRPLQQYLAHCWALVMVSSEHAADSLIAKFKEVLKRLQRLMYEQSHRDYLRLGYLHHRLPVMGC